MWFDQLGEIDMVLEDNNLKDISRSMALKIVHETALKLKKLHTEFDQNKDKIKGKAKEKTTKAY
jgi:hypothetical protein